MNNLLNKLTTSPRAGRLSPLFDIFDDFDRSFLVPENFSNDNISFNGINYEQNTNSQGIQIYN